MLHCTCCVSDNDKRTEVRYLHQSPCFETARCNASGECQRSFYSKQSACWKIESDFHVCRGRKYWTDSRRQSSGTQSRGASRQTRTAQDHSEEPFTTRRTSGGFPSPVSLRKASRRFRGNSCSRNATVPIKFTRQQWRSTAACSMRWTFLNRTWHLFRRSVSGCLNVSGFFLASWFPRKLTAISSGNETLPFAETQARFSFLSPLIQDSFSSVGE